ncbi:hypothetical protein JOB18_044817 [Solea senegalensis]|uniref:Uncharacterized protein n=1 Tax=Solea senegalensis TaxID=28829 RepID=A0AAV6PUT1_SOLSE|nr:hypothetical protein JOB18_044817 [Solea senegalensis]
MKGRCIVCYPQVCSLLDAYCSSDFVPGTGQRGTPQHKARCALSNFFHDPRRRAQSQPPPGGFNSRFTSKAISPVGGYGSKKKIKCGNQMKDAWSFQDCEQD